MAKALCACSRYLLDIERRNYIHNAIPFCNKRKCIERCQLMQREQTARREAIANRGRYIGLTRGG